VREISLVAAHRIRASARPKCDIGAFGQCAPCSGGSQGGVLRTNSARRRTDLVQLVAAESRPRPAAVNSAFAGRL